MYYCMTVGLSTLQTLSLAALKQLQMRMYAVCVSYVRVDVCAFELWNYFFVIITSHRMGETVRERGVLQRKVEVLKNQLKQLHNEIGTLRHSSVSSTDSVFTDSQKSTSESLSSSLSLASKKGNGILLTRFLNGNSPKVWLSLDLTWVTSLLQQMFRSTSSPDFCQIGSVTTEVENELAKIKKVHKWEISAIVVIVCAIVTGIH